MASLEIEIMKILQNTVMQLIVSLLCKTFPRKPKIVDHFISNFTFYKHLVQID